jgi:hypothetical protein
VQVRQLVLVAVSLKTDRNLVKEFCGGNECRCLDSARHGSDALGKVLMPERRMEESLDGVAWPRFDERSLARLQYQQSLCLRHEKCCVSRIAEMSLTLKAVPVT